MDMAQRARVKKILIKLIHHLYVLKVRMKNERERTRLAIGRKAKEETMTQDRVLRAGKEVS